MLEHRHHYDQESRKHSYLYIYIYVVVVYFLSTAMSSSSDVIGYVGMPYRAYRAQMALTWDEFHPMLGRDSIEFDGLD